MINFHLMIIYIIFVHMSLYVMVLQVGKICILDLPQLNRLGLGLG